VSETAVHVPDSPEPWAAARALVEEYAASLKVDLQFQNFQDEIESLPREYRPSDGRFILAARHDEFVACGGVRRYSDSACEMKRLYVVPAHRAAGIARRVAGACRSIATAICRCRMRHATSQRKIRSSLDVARRLQPSVTTSLGSRQ
jgi:GNAT superfamily N-acetyltransferase